MKQANNSDKEMVSDSQESDSDASSSDSNDDGDDDSEFDPSDKSKKAFEKKCESNDYENLYEALRRVTNNFELTYKMVKDN